MIDKSMKFQKYLLIPSAFFILGMTLIGCGSIADKCYGNSMHDVCADVWRDSPEGRPVLVPVRRY